MHRNHPTLALLMLLALSACVDSTISPQSSPATSATSQALTSCNDDCDCTFGEYCRDHVCTVAFSPWPQCFCAARDCAAGQVCGGGFCVSQCSSDCDCPYRYNCSAGQCLLDFGPFPSCSCTLRDCPDGQTCTNGSCSGGTGGGGGGGGGTGGGHGQF